MLRAKRTCEHCGFENAEEGASCPLCGASAARPGAAPDGAPMDGPTLDSGPMSDDGPTVQFPATRRIGDPAPDPSDATRSSALGRVFAERYEVLALLGSGGMGEVYRVRDRRDAKERALKILHPGGDEPDADRSGRFRREAQILSKIQHPAVPRILDSGVESGQLFIVTELVDGHDLKLAIQQRGAWPVDEALALVATVAEALQSAHELGIVHRDVKPNNIMLGKDGSVRLLDFGLARGKGVDMGTLTRTGVIVGTPAYMSPEQFQAHAVDERSDVYSLGVVLYELLTARLPFRAASPLALALKHLQEAPPALRALRPELPVWLERVVLQCLEKEPQRRFPSAAALAAELRKSRSDARLRSRRLPSGDAVLEDQGQASEWSLVLQSPAEKADWAAGMALHFEQRFFRLDRVDAPSGRGGAWIYRFSSWPEGVVFRRLVDYEQDSAARPPEPRSLGERLARLLPGRKA